MPIRVILILASILACHAPTARSQSTKKVLAIDDLYKLDSPTAPALSPNGDRLAYIRQWNDAAKKETRSSLWLVEGSRDKAKAMEASEPDARAPIFSPDGKWIVFLSTRARPVDWKQTPPAPPESDPATDIWLIPASGGTAIPLTGPYKPYGRVFNDGFYGRIAFTPDGKRLVFVADDGVDPRTRQEIDNDVLIVRPDQGEGYTGYRPAQIWVAHLDEKLEKFASRKIERLTEDDVWYGDPQWSPDGQTLVVHANKTDERESVRYSINRNFDIWAIDVATRKQRQLTKGEGPEVSPRFSPDGKKLVCLSVPRKGSHRDVFNLMMIDWSSAEPRTSVLFDHHGADADKLPHPISSFPLPADCWENDSSLIYNSEVGVHSKTARVDVTTAKGDFLEEGNQRSKRRQELTPAGNTFLRVLALGSKTLGTSTVVNWKNDDMKLDGVLTTPPEELNLKTPYKLVVYPHGGPHSRSTLGFSFTVEILAANGYAVFQPNFRGSSGYRQKFIDADRNDFGGGDMSDIMSGVDFLIKEGIADKDRLFVYGTSYGGFMTCWLVGQTSRFKAAVAQNPVTDLNMMWGLGDLQSWTEWEFGGKPWEVPDKMRKHSPLTYADKVKTPTLILHAREDRRCPLPMGKAFHQALLANKVPTQMVIYPNEGHGIKQPRHVEDVLTRLLGWFEKHGK